MPATSSLTRELPSLADSKGSAEELRKYLHYLDDTALSDPKKIEFLRTLWSAMSVFVDLGFDMNSVQHASPSVRVEVQTCKGSTSRSATRGSPWEDIPTLQEHNNGGASV